MALFGSRKGLKWWAEWNKAESRMNDMKEILSRHPEDKKLQKKVEQLTSEYERIKDNYYD
jgi:hypothetical protein